MLTQFVRLPLPNKDQLDAARALATDYEGARVRDMMRVPVVKQQLSKLRAVAENVTVETAEAPAGSFNSLVSSADGQNEDIPLDSEGRPVGTALMQHVKLYRQLQNNWQGYDAYARVSMAMGTNQLLQMLAYCCLQGFISQNSSVLPAIGAVLIFTTCSSLLIRLDIYVPSHVLVACTVLNVLPPFIAAISLTLTLSARSPSSAISIAGSILVPVVFVLHILWLSLMLKLAQAKAHNGVFLPMNFRSVLYLDVFGWLGSETGPRTQAPDQAQDLTSQAVQAGLNVVPEEDQVDGIAITPAPSTSTPAPGVQVPFLTPAAASASGDPQQGLRTSLVRLCYEMKDELDTELAYFECDDVAAMLETYSSQAVTEMRKQLTSLAASLQEAAPEVKKTYAADEEAADAPTVWLKLEWNPSGNAMEFFHCVGAKDGGVVWSRPLPPARIMELEEMRHRLVLLEEKVQLLISEFQSCPEATSPPHEVSIADPPAVVTWGGRGPVRGSAESSAATSDINVVESFRQVLPAPD
eukprot:CAMPEP_0197702314 /NCGR_PEP_ID=MMETSP1338-20131121/124343_1 /TAXON_ID=43686 ORGANISM="Pelagodinium beii, Strain RCC1491" /NCGR_SAMPLE_ID=MMETSP1338 /ASSEMBLY_ACC=CAM_ASM_000754 /LENGTH=523 /DNA_ID=CAMNT_0043286133 /DNA_START=33 /DNA_END=1601 /DNA_ORIENTATION=-